MVVRNHCLSILLAIVVATSLLISPVGAVDTDGDGLLDLLDVPGFNPSASGEVNFNQRGIEDLDGANLLINLRTLDLGYVPFTGNQITSIERGDFEGLTNLQTLRLGANQITSIESGAFEGLANLQTLSLRWNQIASIERGDFEGLVNVQELDLFGNQITSIESGDFEGLDNLQTLSLRFNQITSIESGDFEGLVNLQELDLLGNQITSIESGDFEGLDNLQTLSLRFNQITSIESGDFEGLNNLGRLDLGDNQITSIQRGDFEGLDNLQSLELSGSFVDNRIMSIESGSFAGLANLQFLDLSSIQITSIERRAFEGLNNLGRLDLNGNQITSIESGAFEGLNNLWWLELNDNPITSIERGAFEGLTNLQTLHLRDNQIMELNFTRATFENLSPCGSFIGFCVDGDKIASLILDDATLSQGSFDAIVRNGFGQTLSITDVSLVGLMFSDENPSNLSSLLSITTLDNITVDQSLFDLYADEFNAFAAMDGNTVTVVGYGDSNRDGEFNSSDLITVFAAGEFEDGIDDNSYWTTGDWNGDRDFDSADLILALAEGGYEAGPRAAAVPEPSAFLVLALGLGSLLLCRKPVTWRRSFLSAS